MKKLQIVHNKMVRLITHTKIGDMVPNTKLRAEVGLMSVNQLAVFHMVMDLRKILCNDVCDELKCFRRSYALIY